MVLILLHVSVNLVTRDQLVKVASMIAHPILVRTEESVRMD